MNFFTARRFCVACFVAAPVVFAASPVSANDLEEDVAKYVHASSGDEVSLETIVVPEDLVGQECQVSATSRNQVSLHPGNDLLITSGDVEVSIPGVEDSTEIQIIDAVSIVLDETVEMSLRLGEEGLSSINMTVGFDCEVVEETPVEEEIPSTTVETAEDSTELTQQVAVEGDYEEESTTTDTVESATTTSAAGDASATAGEAEVPDSTMQASGTSSAVAEEIAVVEAPVAKAVVASPSYTG